MSTEFRTKDGDTVRIFEGRANTLGIDLNPHEEKNIACFDREESDRLVEIIRAFWHPAAAATTTEARK